MSHHVAGTDDFLMYSHRLDILPQHNPIFSTTPADKGPYPESSSGLYVLKRALRADKKTIIGDVLPLSQIRSFAEISPRFGPKADPRFKKETCTEYSREFSLNRYFDKDTFFALDTD